MNDAPIRARETLSGAVDAIPQPATVIDSAHAAFAHGVSVAVIVAAGLLAACSIVCLVLMREPHRRTSEAGEPHLDAATIAA